MNFLKNNYKKLILVLCYTIVASVIYAVWFDSIWHLWYVDMIIVIVIVAIAVVIGYFYTKPKKEENITAEENKTTEEVKTENVEINE